MHRLLIAVQLLCAPLQLASQDPTDQPATDRPLAGPLRIPAFTAHVHPDASAERRERDGSVTSWRGQLRYHGLFRHTGRLRVKLLLETPGDTSCTLRLQVGTQPDGEGHDRTVTVDSGDREIDCGSFEVRQAAEWTRLTVELVDGLAPHLQALELSGPAALDAHFSDVERRNCASVHLGYPVRDAERDRVEWFYCELTPQTEPLWTYYEATGWHRGYFGMQVNSPTERRLIFSVWDSGDEAVDRAKVKADDQVRLLARGEGVHASGFGNEGTGGHSHLVYPWRLGDTFRFLVHAEPDGDHTTYTGWFWFAERKGWGLIASFRAPKDGSFLNGLYSFNENFGGANGDLPRECEFGNQWIGTADGRWLPVLDARFTHDGHGREQRLDRSAGVRGDRFYLKNGGFLVDREKTTVSDHGAPLHRERGTDQPPAVDALPTVGDADRARARPPEQRERGGR